MERWRGKLALVTGASAGIGFAIAEGLLAAGVNVVGCARNPTSLEVWTRSISILSTSFYFFRNIKRPVLALIFGLSGVGIVKNYFRDLCKLYPNIRQYFINKTFSSSIKVLNICAS